MKNRKLVRSTPAAIQFPRNVRVESELSAATRRFAFWLFVTMAGCCGILAPVVIFADAPRFEMGVALIAAMALAAATGMTEAATAWREMHVADGKLGRREEILAEFRTRH